MTFSTIGTDIQTGKPVHSYKTSRTQGLCVIGLQRMGKSGLFENLIIDDIKQGTGVCVLDPHGELIDHVIARLPGKAEEEKVLYLDMKGMLSFFGLPLLDCADLKNELSVERTRSQFLNVFEIAFGITEANPVMYTLLSNIAYTLIANPGHTMIDIRQLLTNRSCRESLLQNRFLVEHKQAVIDFWHTHYDQLSPQRQDEESFFILNKLNDFENAPLRYIVGQSKSTIHPQKIMDESKILLVKLDRQLEQATSLIGSILVALILNASDSRNSKKLFNVYADELQNFATPDFAVLLEQAGKRNIGISMAHQNRAQLQLSDTQADSQLKARTLNVGSLMVFRVPTDAVTLAQQFDSTPPPPEIIGQRPIFSPKRDVVDHLVRNGHKNPTANSFTSTYLVPLTDLLSQNANRKQIDWMDKTSFFEESFLAVDDLREGIHELNNTLYACMVDHDAQKPISPYTLLAASFCFKFTQGIGLGMGLLFGKGYNVELKRRFKPRQITLDLCQPDVFSHLEELKFQIAKKDKFDQAIAFLRSLRSVMEVLASDPILVNTGQHEPIYDKPRTYQDVQNEVANMLVSLPKFQARVKLTDGSDTIVEHTITTREPEKGLYGRMLDERIDRIKAQNRKDGYTRPRQDVEVEIRMRQNALKQAQQPQKIVQEPMKRRIPLPAASDSQLEQPILSPAELQERYQEYVRDMRKLGRKPLMREAWEKLELAKYAAENE